MNTILIFGIGGFVGGYLTKELTGAGYTVYGSDIFRDEEHPIVLTIKHIDVYAAATVVIKELSISL